VSSRTPTFNGSVDVGVVTPTYRAAPVDSPEDIRELLFEQITFMVRWRESIEAMAAAGVTHFVEFGGKVLSPMVKRIAPDARTTSVVTPEDIDALVGEI
jgi:[acyl-carrier-protein] S-malonyltransferase